ncbi:preprotein translocase subunit SecY [Mycoplasma corogypsi]|uniref:preprotein translocase subunit SecY n=1 Tax=Mycoplasma corogypsi TaxID=2106 RepID=UPI003873CCD9
MHNKNQISFTQKFLHFRSKWKHFWQTKGLFKKFVYTCVLLIIFVIGTTITLPFVRTLQSNFANNQFLNTLNLVGGGGLRQFSIFSLGISPFINASLIMMILQTKIFKPIYKLSQSGPAGRRKINIITRFVTLIIAVPQAIFFTKGLSSGVNFFIQIDPGNSGISHNTLTFFVLPLFLIMGTLFAIFISEQITNHGIGNGTSLLIFTGIASRLPFQFKDAYLFVQGSDKLVSTVNFFIYVISFILVLIVVAIVYAAERHVPIQQVGVGRAKKIKDIGKLPIKLNPGGIMPIIFAMMVLSLPTMVTNLLPKPTFGTLWVQRNLQFTQPLGFSLLVVITFVFALIMGIQQSKIDKVAEDFIKNSTFVPGVRPGEETQDYLISIVLRLSFFSSFYLVLLGGMQFIEIMLGVQQSIAFGGTSLMILVSVSLETFGQIQARSKSARLAKQKRAASYNLENYDQDTTKNEGLLW